MIVWAQAADEKETKEPKKPDPPRISTAIPFGVIAGATNQVRVRGASLTNVTELRFIRDGLKPIVTIRSAGKAEIPKDGDAKKLGDTQLELLLTVPAETPPGTNSFVVTSPDGVSEPQALVIFPAGELVAEREPNGGYRVAQSLRLGQTVSGVISEAGDVEVFRFVGSLNQRVRIEVRAAGFASALDSVLTLLDASGHVLATQDDAGSSRDSVIESTLPADGEYFISLIDAHEKGGPTHTYLLTVGEAL